MSDQKPFDPETASMDELRAQANSQTEAHTFDVKTPTEKPTPPTPEEDVEEQVIYTRRIDLGDGSGVQVFSADSLEGLIDKLTEAQLNATKKIRELNSQLPKPTSKPKEQTADEEFILSQELMTKPSKAFEKMFQDTVGMPITEFKTKMERVTAFEQAQAFQQATVDFVAQTPEYHVAPANGKRIMDYLRIHNLPGTVESMTTAFNELNSAGLLQAKPAATPEVEPEVKTVTVTEHTRQVPKRTSSGLSSKNSSTPTRAPKTGPTEAELYNMPLEQLRELERAALRGETSEDF